MPKKKEEIKDIEQSRSISWRAAEYRYIEKGPAWYLIIIVAGLALIIFAITQRNFFFALFIVFAEVILLYFSRRRPRVVDFVVNDEGIGIGKNAFYSYDILENFAIYERPQQLNGLVLKRKAMINPYVRLPIDSELAPKVRSFLSQKLAEVEYEPSLIDILADWLGF